MMDNIVVFVEGEGDVKAVPHLLKKILKVEKIHNFVIDDDPFKIGNFVSNSHNHFAELRRWINAALKRKGCVGVICILDGDCLKHSNFKCILDCARELAKNANKEGAGTRFSFAAVFALQEYESWLVGSIESISTKINHFNKTWRLEELTNPKDLETLRDAKKLLKKAMPHYRPNQHQLELTEAIDIKITCNHMRSFRRLVNALNQISQCIACRTHHLSPPLSPD